MKPRKWDIWNSVLHVKLHATAQFVTLWATSVLKSKQGVIISSNNKLLCTNSPSHPAHPSCETASLVCWRMAYPGTPTSLTHKENKVLHLRPLSLCTHYPSMLENTTTLGSISSESSQYLVWAGFQETSITGNVHYLSPTCTSAQYLVSCESLGSLSKGYRFVQTKKMWHQIWNNMLHLELL